MVRAQVLSDTSDVLNNIKLSFDPGTVSDNGRFYSERCNGFCLCVFMSLLRPLYHTQLDTHTHTHTHTHTVGIL
jgi:hypothetical protein